MSNTERAWAAGFFDGEGSTVPNRTRNGNLNPPSISINQASDNDLPPEVLERFCRAVGVMGKITGPYIQENRKPRYNIRYGRLSDVRSVLEALWPYLGSVKREQATRCMDAYAADAARRAPFHQKNRTHCPQGHEYTHDNTYVSKSGSRHCSTCSRDRSREYQRRRRAASLSRSENSENT